MGGKGSGISNKPKRRLRRYRSGSVRALDQRYRPARELKRHIRAVAEPLGGLKNLTQVQRDLVERYAHHCAELSELEIMRTSGKAKPSDKKRYLALTESVRRLTTQLQPAPERAEEETDIAKSFAKSFDEVMASPPTPPRAAPQPPPPPTVRRLPAPLTPVEVLPRERKPAPGSPLIDVTPHRGVNDSRVRDSSNDHRPHDPFADLGVFLTDRRSK